MDNMTIEKEIDTTKAQETTGTPCREDVSARTEFSKQFIDPSQGTRTAVLFSSPVHYSDGEAMREIDNSFNEAVNADGEEVYENRGNRFRVRIAKRTAGNKLVEVTEGKYGISMTPTSVAALGGSGKTMRAVKRKVTAQCGRRGRQAEAMPIEFKHGGKRLAMHAHAPSDVCFEKALGNCDLEYSMENSRIKENIIVNEKSDFYEYSFKLNLDNLEARACDDRSIELYDPETNEVKYMIPAPFMFDADGETSDSVGYTLRGKAGAYTLKITADSEWINAEGRKLPVTIDPQIMQNDKSAISLYYSEDGGAFYATTRAEIS